MHIFSTISLLLEQGPDDTVLEDIDESASDKPKKILACALCKAEITSDKNRIGMKGGHEHRFFNPHGIVYHIGCFQDAPGCRPSGPISGEFSWFPGYNWRIVCCFRCENHLGWSFEGGGAPFYGLILDRLASLEPDENQ